MDLFSLGTAIHRVLSHETHLPGHENDQGPEAELAQHPRNHSRVCRFFVLFLTHNSSFVICALYTPCISCSLMYYHMTLISRLVSYVPFVGHGGSCVCTFINILYIALLSLRLRRRENISRGGTRWASIIEGLVWAWMAWDQKHHGASSQP